MARSNHTIETIFNLISETNLSDREKTVVKQRLLGVTLKAIGKELTPLWQPENNDDGALDTERIRQIEAKACRKLRHPSRFGKRIYK